MLDARIDLRLTGDAVASRYRRQGFTLIELMIAVTIVAILAAIALPSYRDYVMRGQLVNATTALSAMRAKMEQYYQDNRTYLATGTSPNNTTPPCTVASTAGNFSVSCASTTGGTAPTATTYVIGAKAASGTPTAGAVYTIDQNNTQATVSLPTVWGTATSQSCWIVKRGTTC